MCREDYIYKKMCESKYFTGIFNAENDVLERPWLYRCFKEFREFRTDGIGIWESYYQPGVSRINMGIDSGIESIGKKVEDTRLVESFVDMKETCGVKLGERSRLLCDGVKGFGDGARLELEESLTQRLVPDFTYTNSRYDIDYVDKGVYLGDFVVSKTGNAGKVEKLVSMTRISGPGDILTEDRISINKGSQDFVYNMEKKVYNLDYLDNVVDKKMLSLIEVDEGLQVLLETDSSYTNVGHDTVIGLEEKGISQGYLGLEKILYEMNVLPASGWLIDFCFFVAGAAAVGAAVWVFYVGLGKLKEYIEMSGIWDPEYKYWEVLYGIESEGIKMTEPVELEKLGILKDIIKEINWSWLEGII